MRWIWKTEIARPRADAALLEALQKGEGESLEAPPFLSRSQLQELILKGLVTRGDLSIRRSQSLMPGDVIVIEFPLPPPQQLVPEEHALEYLFEDEHLLIVNKPAGLTVHPSPTQMTQTLVHALLFHEKPLAQAGGELRPGIVHRLDKNTSGSLVLAKTDICYHKLVQIFAKHEIERTYWALCYGSIHPSTGKIESLIGRDPKNRQKMSTRVKIGKPAVSLYESLEAFGQANHHPFASWIKMTLLTGRTHQIRLHLTEKGNPVLGDATYGTPSKSQARWKALPLSVQQKVNDLPGQALHARSLGFTHPMTQERVFIEANPPAAFQSLLDLLTKKEY